jgi:hypothetical protein
LNFDFVIKNERSNCKIGAMWGEHFWKDGGLIKEMKVRKYG